MTLSAMLLLCPPKAPHPKKTTKKTVYIWAKTVGRKAPANCQESATSFIFLRVFFASNAFFLMTFNDFFSRTIMTFSLPFFAHDVQFYASFFLLSFFFRSFFCCRSHIPSFSPTKSFIYAFFHMK